MHRSHRGSWTVVRESTTQPSRAPTQIEAINTALILSNPRVCSELLDVFESIELEELSSDNLDVELFSHSFTGNLHRLQTFAHRVEIQKLKKSPMRATY